MRITGFLAIAVLLFAGIFCSGADFSDRIPATADVAIGINCRAALKNPLVQDYVPDLSKQLQKAGVPEKYANNPAKCFGNALITINAKQQTFAMLLETSHITLENLAAYEGDGGEPKKIIPFGSYRAFKSEPVLVIDLGEGVFLFCEEKNWEENTGTVVVNTELQKLFRSTDKSAVVRGAMITRDVPLPENPQQQEQLPKLQGSTFSLQLTGKDGAHVIWDSKAIAVSEEEAARAQLLIQQMLLVGSMLMGDQPELAQNLIQSVRIARNGTTVSCCADLSSPLTKQFFDYISQRAKKDSSEQPVSPQAMPPDVEKSAE